MSKVNKKNTPVLMLGLGGTGADAILRLKHDFSNRFVTEQRFDGSFEGKPPSTEFLVIDTDSCAAGVRRNGIALENDEFLFVGGNLSQVFGAIGNKPYVAEWLDEKVKSLMADGNGSAACRQAARLLLFNKVNEVLSRLADKLHRLNAGAFAGEAIKVKLIAGTAGGTGSGLLLDVAYLLKYLAEQLPCRIDVEAYLMLPDVTIERIGAFNPPLVRHFRVNGYSLLKELDYWMNAAAETGVTMRQSYSEYLSVIWKGRPFDEVYLMGARNDQGDAIRNAYEHNLAAISEYLVQRCAAHDIDYGIISGMHNRVRFLDQERTANGSYSSIGVFTNDAEQRMLELKQWELIYAEAVNRMDANHVPMEGAAPVEFCKAVLGLTSADNTAAGNVRKGYNMRHPVPMLDSDMFSLQALRMSDEFSAPHAMVFDTFYTDICKAHDKETEQLTGDVWSVFEAEARRVCEDIGRGPAYLLQLLRDGDNSLQARLNQTIAEIDNRYRMAESMIDTHRQHCHRKFDMFANCGIIDGLFRRRQYYDDYMNEVRALYDASRASCYYKALLPALADFGNRLGRYIDALATLVSGIYDIKCDIGHEIAVCDVPAALFDINAECSDLTQLFGSGDNRDAAVKTVYDAVSDISMTAADDFCASQARGMLDKAFDGMRIYMFADIAYMSVSNKLSKYAGVSGAQEMQAHIANNICPGIDASARAMFGPAEEAAGLQTMHAVSSAYIVVPDDMADGVRQYFENTGRTCVVSDGDSDRVVFINIKSGMPLYCYDQFELLRGDYTTADQGYVIGNHLYMVPADSAEGIEPIKHNWGKTLPDPKLARCRIEAEG